MCTRWDRSSGAGLPAQARIYVLKTKFKKLSAMDVLARASMKDAAKCDTHCELQISVNHQISERIWRCWDFPAARLFQCLLTPQRIHHRLWRRNIGQVNFKTILLFDCLLGCCFLIHQTMVSYGRRENLAVPSSPEVGLGSLAGVAFTATRWRG